jgi:hypothetical protein
VLGDLQLLDQAESVGVQRIKGLLGEAGYHVAHAGDVNAPLLGGKTNQHVHLAREVGQPISQWVPDRDRNSGPDDSHGLEGEGMGSGLVGNVATRFVHRGDGRIGIPFENLVKLGKPALVNSKTHGLYFLESTALGG